jgi:hypothetical protein
VTVRKLKESAVDCKNAARWTLVKLPSDEQSALFKEKTMPADVAKWSVSQRERAQAMCLQARGQKRVLIADHLQRAETKFCNDLGLGPCEWIGVAGFSSTVGSFDANANEITRISQCDIEVAVHADASSLFPALDDVEFSPLSPSSLSSLSATPALLAWATALWPHEFDCSTASVSSVSSVSSVFSASASSVSALVLSNRVRKWRADHSTVGADVREPLIVAARALNVPDLVNWKPAALTSIAPLVIASFDCEMYSDDDTFPDVVRGHSTKYIGTNFRIGGPSGPLVRVMQCVGAVGRPLGCDATQIHVECYASEQECYEAWRDLIISVDPDILVSWNGFGFDFPFMHADYMQTFATIGERCTEGMQHAMRVKAQRMLLSSSTVATPIDSTVFEGTCPHLLMRLRVLMQTANPGGWRDVKTMLHGWSRTYGSKIVNTLVAAEQVAKAVDKLRATREKMACMMEDFSFSSFLNAALIAKASGALACQDEREREQEQEQGQEQEQDEDDCSDESSDSDGDSDSERRDARAAMTPFDDEEECEREDALPTTTPSIKATAASVATLGRKPTVHTQDNTTAALVNISSLPAGVASELRLVLRDKLREEVNAATKRLAALGKGPTRHVTAANAEIDALCRQDLATRNLGMLLKQLAERPSSAPVSTPPFIDPLAPALFSHPRAVRTARDDFYNWVASQKCLGLGVVRLLAQPECDTTTPLPLPRRGLFLSRLSAEACELSEKRMTSAAKGDNVYNYYKMAGRTPVDLMQIVKASLRARHYTHDNATRYYRSCFLLFLLLLVVCCRMTRSLTTIHYAMLQKHGWAHSRNQTRTKMARMQTPRRHAGRCLPRTRLRCLLQRMLFRHSSRRRRQGLRQQTMRLALA